MESRKEGKGEKAGRDDGRKASDRESAQSFSATPPSRPDSEVRDQSDEDIQRQGAKQKEVRDHGRIRERRVTEWQDEPWQSPRQYWCDESDAEIQFRQDRERDVLHKRERPRGDDIRRVPQQFGGEEHRPMFEGRGHVQQGGGDEQRGEFNRGSFLARVREVTPDKFDGRIPWKDYQKHFEACSVVNRWTKREASFQLATRLQGPALKVLGNFPLQGQPTYEDLVSQLSKDLAQENMLKISCWS